MRRLVKGAILVLAIVALGGGAYAAIDIGLRTCAPLDRLLKRSGCVKSVTLDDFRPALFETILVSPNTGRLGVVGATRTVDGWRSAIARVDLAQGVEIDRHPLPIREFGPMLMRVSTDGVRAVVTCRPGDPCVREGQGVSVDPDDPVGAEILEKADPYRAAPPGAPDFPNWLRRRAIPTPDLASVVYVDEGRGDLVVAGFWDGQESARMRLPKDVRFSRFDQAMAISRDGRLVALRMGVVPRLKIGSRALVYDLGQRRLVATVETDETFESQRSLAFLNDGSGLVMARRLKDPARFEIALFDLNLLKGGSR